MGKSQVPNPKEVKPDRRTAMRRKAKHHKGLSAWKAALAGVLTVGMALAIFPGPARAQDARAQTLLQKVVAAHGGIQAWENLKDMTFTITRVALDPRGDVAGANVSLYYMKRHGKTRVETITGKGLLVQGFDGQKPWVTLDGKPKTGKAALEHAHFLSVNWWYWMGIPFKLKDPGVFVRHKGTLTFRGKPVDILEATFQQGVGETNDRYTYYIDQKTHHILFVEFQLQPGVWPKVGGPTPKRSTWLDYNKERPFTMHTKRIFYGNPELTDKRAILLFRDFKFNTGLPDKLFAAP
jgi:hypothetical protein